MHIKVLFIAILAVLVVLGIVVAVYANELQWLVGGLFFAGVNLMPLVRLALPDRRRPAQTASA